MPEETKDEQLPETPKPALYDPKGAKQADEHLKRKMRSQIFRAVQYDPNTFWVHNGTTGILCSKKMEGISFLKEKYPGDYEVINIILNKKQPTENSKK